jgi:hypothetical protein
MSLHLTADYMYNSSGISLASGHLSLTNGNSVRHTRPWEGKNKPPRDMSCTFVLAVCMNNVPKVFVVIQLPVCVC